MVAFTGNDPRSATLKNSETVSGVGIILAKDGTKNKVQLVRQLMFLSEYQLANQAVTLTKLLKP